MPGVVINCAPPYSEPRPRDVELAARPNRGPVGCEDVERRGSLKRVLPLQGDVTRNYLCTGVLAGGRIEEEELIPDPILLIAQLLPRPERVAAEEEKSAAIHFLHGPAFRIGLQSWYLRAHPHARRAAAGCAADRET